ncbi:hypothetical protein WA026_015018 [Henosepilachna vigintioctopunctata]|uniref:Uncharacterized protein n=1 Tax=Henosepilachna vigintioctopunctata TaxID=420089 RepID=A0AAW1UA32_9CUCU
MSKSLIIITISVCVLLFTRAAFSTPVSGPSFTTLQEENGPEKEPLIFPDFPLSKLINPEIIRKIFQELFKGLDFKEEAEFVRDAKRKYANSIHY